jgi:flagellar biosynthesis/type III secretory pathway chaperone
MNFDWQIIAESLRAEIGEYGGLLHLFEEQQRQLFARDADAVLHLSESIQAHVGGLHDTRRTREQRVAALARAVGQPDDSSLRSLLPFLAPEARPLLEALIGEINLLVHRTRRVSRHNHSLLKHAMESRQQLLRVLRPDGFVQTYGAQGRLAAVAAVPVATLHAAG